MGTPKIKLFRIVLDHFDAMGFYEPSQRDQMCEWNRQNIFVFFICAATLIAAGFTFLEAHSAYEYSTSSYVSFTAIAMIAYLSTIHYRMGSARDVIEKYEEFIAKRA